MFKILYFVCFALQVPASALFIDFRFKKIPNKFQKMICSTLFIFAAVFAFLENGAMSFYTGAILAGLVFAWIGDLALSASSKGAEFIIGLLSFLLTHCSYIVAFHSAEKRLFSARFLTLGEAAAVAVMLVILIAVKKAIKLELKDMAAPVFAYAAAISLMTVKTFSLGLRCVFTHAVNAYLTLAVLGTAAVMMVVSDPVLVLILFMNKFNQKTELINDASYYLAQMLFAGSIMLLG